MLILHKICMQCCLFSYYTYEQKVLIPISNDWFCDHMILRGHVTTRSLPFGMSVDGGSTVYTLPYLKDHLAPVHGSLKLVDGGVEG